MIYSERELEFTFAKKPINLHLILYRTAFKALLFRDSYDSFFSLYFIISEIAAYPH